MMPRSPTRPLRGAQADAAAQLEADTEVDIPPLQQHDVIGHNDAQHNNQLLLSILMRRLGNEQTWQRHWLINRMSSK
jgi:hypothetical protein